MKKIIFVALALTFNFFMTANASAATCPLGAKDDHLTVHRIMINYGKYVGPADHIVLLGARYPNETVTDSDISTSIDQLGLAIACAQAILDNPTGDLLPDKASFLTGQEQKDYIDDFVYFTNEFHDALVVYRDSFKKMLATPKASRNWELLYAESKELNDLIDHAHRKTSIEMGQQNFAEAMPLPGGTLKANMKEIGSRFKAIAASVTDANQNPTNALLADEITKLMLICKQQIPEGIMQIPDAAQRQKAMTDYQATLQEGADLSVKLQQALIVNDNVTAQALLLKLKQLKIDGHDRFNP